MVKGFVDDFIAEGSLEEDAVVEVVEEGMLKGAVDDRNAEGSFETDAVGEAIGDHLVEELKVS